MIYQHTAEGTISRNLNFLLVNKPELAPTAALLVKHLGAAAYYEKTGSVERDAEARINGEFREGYEYRTELPIGDNAEREVLYA